MTWRWRLENAAGEAVSAGGAENGFPTQGEAESWVGEEWKNLLAAGVVAVFLLEGERQVYGPMSLLPAD